MVKLRQRQLQEIVARLHIPDTRVVVGPRLGEDAAVVDVQGLKYLITHTDPITGACEYLGWLSIVVSSNDVAVQGGAPRWCEVVLLLPEKFPDESLRRIVDQMREACMEIGVSVIGGHTEYAPGLSMPISVVTCIGVSDRYVTTSGARPGDYVIVAKSPALEAALVVASDFRSELEKRGISSRVIDRVLEFRREICLVREALAVRDLVTSMHDPTEGGIVQALLEMAQASGTVIELWLSRVPIRSEVKMVLEAVGVDPPRALSSGTLLCTADPDSAELVLRKLSRLCREVAIVGRVIERADVPHVRVLDQEGGRTLYKVSEQIDDEIMLLWSRIRSST